jgi:hypothetical protein
MAFNREDTDAIYDRTVQTCLKSLGIRPIRIDRVEHNDDIDDRIVEELKSCDFVIADLTYARPSVYFEAGFAQRKIPVIYTCRADHFNPKSNDPNGNLRVHFDVQNRNIVPWNNPKDLRFRNKLIKRIRFVIAPLVREMQKSSSETDEIQRFRSKSVHERLVMIRNEAVSILSNSGYVSQDVNRGSWVGLLRRRRKLFFACTFIGERFSRTDVSWIAHHHAVEGPSAVVDALTSKKKPHSHYGPTEKSRVPATQLDVFVCTLGKLNQSVISSVLAEFAYDSTMKWFVGSNRLSLAWPNGGARTAIRIHAIDGISSLASLGSELLTLRVHPKEVSPN